MSSFEARERRTAAIFVSPAIAVIALVALVPIALTFWEALHSHDLRLPWLGRPFVGVDNFAERRPTTGSRRRSCGRFCSRS